MRGRFRALKLLAFVALAFGLLFVAEISQAVAESFLKAEEDQMTALVNQHRAGHEYKPLKVNSALRWVARRQAQRMVMAGYIHHNPDLEKEADKAIPGWMLLGENVGVGAGVNSVNKAFLGSPHHHENYDTKKYNIVGIGAMANDSGDMYFTQDFALYGSTKARAAAPVKKAAPKAQASKPATKRSPAPKAPTEIARAADARTPARRPVSTRAPEVQGTQFTPTPAAPPAAGGETVTLSRGLLAMLKASVQKPATQRSLAFLFWLVMAAAVVRTGADRLAIRRAPA